MKKAIAIAVTLLLVAGLVAAEDRMDMDHHDWDSPFAEERIDVMNRYSDLVPGELTFGQRNEIAGALSIPLQKDLYVMRSSFASAISPGMGQFMNKDAASGALFAAGDLLIAAGTMVGAYFLLPAELQFDQLDYLDSSKTEIKDAWEAAFTSITVREALPLAAVMGAGMLLDQTLAWFSARHAGRLALDRIRAGEVVFHPRPQLVMHGHFGLGMSFGY